MLDRFEHLHLLHKEFHQKDDLVILYSWHLLQFLNRLFVGPFKNFKALKTTYISLNKLGFEDLSVHKE